MSEKTLAELHRENVEAHMRAVAAADKAVVATKAWVDAEASYARWAPWLYGIIFVCGVLALIGGPK